MIVKMTKYSILLLSGKKDSALEQIQKIGLMDITRSAKPVDKTSESMLADIAQSKRALDMLESIDLSKEEDYLEIQKAAKTLQPDGRDPLTCLGEYCSQLETMEARLAEVNDAIAYSRIWGDFDAAKLNALAENGLELHFYSVGSEKYSDEWAEKWPLRVIDRDAKSVWFVTVGKCDDIPAKELPKPEKSGADLNKEGWDLRQDILLCKAKLELLKGRSKEAEKLYNNQVSELNLYLAKASGDTAAEGQIAVLTGFAPTENDAEICEALDKMDLYYLKEKATKEDNPPIKLRNNWFARNFETLTGMYGMPVYDEFDPTPVLAPFFLLFWAFCMGDAGYGLVLIAVGILLRKYNILDLKNHWRLVTTLGVGATIIGFFLGTFFGVGLSDVAWIPECLRRLMLAGKISVGGAAYDVSMVAAIVIGVFHICLAMVIKAIGLTKRFGFKEAISTWGWIVLIIGGICVAALALTSVLNAAATKIAVIVIGVISCLGIFILNKPGRNPLINIGAGLWDTYGMATGILGDVLSYIRLYALGLAGGMLGGAFNDLAQMTLGSNPTWQWLPWLLIVILGHTLNFAMSCLGAFVHPLRLTFVEYFKNSGYEGKGTKFNPLK